jgi:glycerol dehydrogenase
VIGTVYDDRILVSSGQWWPLPRARPTLAASALGERCATTVFAEGVAAVDAVRRRDVTDALEHIVEANTLLSGLGFESGGLAVAHAVAQGFTALPTVHQQYLHGEMVAMGLLTQLMVERRAAEAQQVAAFFAQVGLPIHLGQLTLSPQDTASLRLVMETATRLPYVGNEPFPVTTDTLLAALQHAHALGQDIAQQAGDAAYGALHAP